MKNRSTRYERNFKNEITLTNNNLVALAVELECRCAAWNQWKSLCLIHWQIWLEKIPAHSKLSIVLLKVVDDPKTNYILVLTT